MTAPSTDQNLKVFRVYIKATPAQVWDGIVDPAWNGRYGYQVATQYSEVRPGGHLRVVPTDEMVAYGAPALMIDGEVLEAEPPHRLVQTYKMHFSPEMSAEPYTTVTYEIVEEQAGLCRLTIVHDTTGAPLHAATVSNDAPLHEGGGGFAWILSDLKSLLESGASMSAST
jgi:uncharacterized protein YndB with AHSA1/START domain